MSVTDRATRGRPAEAAAAGVSRIIGRLAARRVRFRARATQSTHLCFLPSGARLPLVIPAIGAVIRGRRAR